jgi:multiple sugar transport system substrate-binding protein
VAWLWYALYMQNGGSAADKEGKPTVNTPEAIDALKLQVKLRNDGCLAKGEIGKAYESFNQGKMGGTNAGTWMVNEFDAQVKDPKSPLKNYYVAPFPQIGKVAVQWGGSHTFVVPLGPKPDPARVKAAVQYLKFFYDNQLAWARTGHSAVRKSVVASKEYNALPHRSEYGDFVNHAMYHPFTVWATAFDQIMEEEVQAAVLGKKTPEQALNDAQDRLTDIASFQ